MCCNLKTKRVSIQGLSDEYTQQSIITNTDTTTTTRKMVPITGRAGSFLVI